MRARPIPLGLACALALAALLALLTGVPEPASAQSTGGLVRCAEPICFQHSAVDYLEGSTVTVFFNGTPMGFRDVTVSCPLCPIPTTYRAVLPEDRTIPLRFPEDFGAPASEPRWAGTYTVTVLNALGQPWASRAFQVHATDAFRHPDGTAHVRAPLVLQASGYTPGSRVTFHLYRISGFGGCTAEAATGQCLVGTLTATAYGPQGVATVTWSPPNSLASSLDCAYYNNETCRSFWVEPRGPGKSNARDSSGFKLAPARVVAYFATGPNRLTSAEAPEVVLNRTDDVRAVMFLLYGGSRYGLHGSDVSGGPWAQLNVGLYRSTNGFPPERVRMLTANYDPLTTAWVVNWTAPKDQSYVGQRYFLKLEESRDRYGNIIQATPSQGFRLQPLAIEARFVDPPLAIERADLVNLTLDLRYHDRSPFTDQDAAGPLRGCLVGAEETISQRCLGRPLITATHRGNGQWVFPLRFPVGDARLQAFRFVMEGNVTDRTGKDTEAANHVVANATAPFHVVPAKLRLVLDTASIGTAKPANTVLERGERVSLLLRVTYPDGTPFNASRNPTRDVLPLSIFQINRAGAVVRIQTLNLTAVDAGGPLWAAEFDIPLMTTDLVEGVWQFRVDARDIEPVPNAGGAVFERTVRSAVLTVLPEALSPRTVLAGNEVRYTFRILYPNGAAATSNDLGLDLRVDALVYERGRVTASSHEGLRAIYDEASVSWTVVWKTPRTVPLATHVFIVQGTDRYGNTVNASLLSPPFDVYLEQFTRPVITQPDVNVERGHSAYVLFKGVQGDWGDGATGRPRIEVQQQAPNGDWSVKVLDVYAVNESLPVDHLGVWKTNKGSTAGTYRFAFYGREHNRAFLVGYSNPFNLTHTTLSREVVQVPELINPKGTTVRVGVERIPGDAFGLAQVYRGTFHVSNARLERPNAGNWTIAWSIPFAMDTGTYTIVFLGSDGYGNLLRTVSPPFLVAETGLASSVVLQPPVTVPRGDLAKFSFQVKYPDGRTPMTGNDGYPTVTLRNESGIVQTLLPAWNRSIWEVTWRPGASLPLGDYFFSVTGEDNHSSPITPLHSRHLTVVAGSFARSFIVDADAEYPRLATLRAGVSSEDQDAFVTFTLGYVSRYAVPYDQVAKAKPIPAATVNYTWNPALGRYDLVYRVPLDLPLGHYVVDMKGLDKHGNTLTARSRLVSIRSSVVSVAYDANTPISWGSGEVTQARFRVIYQDGTEMTDEMGTPVVTVYWNAQPLKEKIDLQYEGGGYWTAAWQAPPELPEGRYYFRITGEDKAGNLFAAGTSQDTLIETSSWKKIFGVPDLGAPAAVVLLALAALALRPARAGRRD